MADIIIPDGYGNAVFSWTYTGRVNPLTSTLGYHPTSVGSPGAIANKMFDDSAGSGAPNFHSNMGDGWTFLGVKCTENDGGTLIGGESTRTPIAGTLTGISSPALNTSLLLQKRTGLLGRKFRGRMYWVMSAVNESAVDTLGILGSTELSFLNPMFTAWETAMATSPTYAPVLLHSDPTAPTNITSFLLVSKVATQRRRMR